MPGFNYMESEEATTALISTRTHAPTTATKSPTPDSTQTAERAEIPTNINDLCAWQIGIKVLQYAALDIKNAGMPSASHAQRQYSSYSCCDDEFCCSALQCACHVVVQHGDGAAAFGWLLRCQHLYYSCG